MPLLTLSGTNVKETNIDFVMTLKICFPDCSRLKQSKQAWRVFSLKNAKYGEPCLIDQ